MDITPLARNEWICLVTSAKQPQTRERRLGGDPLHSSRRASAEPVLLGGLPFAQKNGG